MRVCASTCLTPPPFSYFVPTMSLTQQPSALFIPTAVQLVTAAATAKKGSGETAHLATQTFFIKSRLLLSVSLEDKRPHSSLTPNLHFYFCFIIKHLLNSPIMDIDLSSNNTRPPQTASVKAV